MVYTIISTFRVITTQVKVVVCTLNKNPTFCGITAHCGAFCVITDESEWGDINIAWYNSIPWYN